MKEKIMNIRNILKIIISLFIIFFMIKSCANASFTMTEVKNIAYARCKNRGYSDYQAETQCNKLDNVDASTYADNDNYDIVAHFEGDSLIFYICDNRLAKRLAANANGKTYCYVYYSAYIYMPIYNLNNWNLGTPGISVGNSSTSLWLTSRNNIYSPNLSIYDNRNGNNTLLESAPIIYPSWFYPNGPYTDFVPYWVFAKTGETDIRIEGFTPTIRLLSRERINTYLGQLNNSEYCSTITADTIAYNKGTNAWSDRITNVTLYNEDMGDIQDVFNTTYHEENEGYYISDINIRSLYLPTNTVLMLGFTPKEEYEELYPNDVIGMYEYFYLYDSNTILSGDYLDIDATFNNTYYDDYQENLDNNYSNIQDDINNENIQNMTNDIADIKEEQRQRDSWWRQKVNDLINPKSRRRRTTKRRTRTNIKVKWFRRYKRRNRNTRTIKK